MSYQEKIPNLRLETFEEVEELAFTAQEHLDGVEDEIEPIQLLEVGSILDNVSASTLYGREIAIAGIFKRYDPDHESPSGIKTTLVEGLIEGISTGFAVKRLDEFEPELGTEEEGEVFDKLRKAAMGSYLVCHMLTHRVKPACSDDMGVLMDMKWQAFAPIVASGIHLFGELEPALSQTTIEDVKLISSGVDKPSRRAFDRIVELMEGSDDALTSLRSAAPHADKIMNRNNAAVRQALLRTLFNMNGIGGENYRYRFEEFPPVMFEAEGHGTLGTVQKEFVGDIFVEGLTVARKYFVDGKGNVIIPSRYALGLFVNVAAPVNPHQTDRFAIPLNLIKTGTYVRA